MIKIESLVFQRPVSLIQKYEFTLTYRTEDDTQVLMAEVTVSHTDGRTTIEGIAVENMPDEIVEVWDPEWAIKQIINELGEELNKISAPEETFTRE